MSHLKVILYLKCRLSIKDSAKSNTPVNPGGGECLVVKTDLGQKAYKPYFSWISASRLQ